MILASSPAMVPEMLVDILYAVSHPILRPNRMLIVYVSRNQVYTHTIQKMDTK
jgi:hypothetical protein